MSVADEIPLRREEFLRLRELIHSLCGLVVPDDKEYLIRQRLGPLARETGCASFADFAGALAAAGPGHLRNRVVEEITTHETSFFRDAHPFRTFERVLLPALAEEIRFRKGRVPPRRGPKARLWCAAASTGQEPYSFAMLIDEYIRAHPGGPMERGDIAILATDISSGTLARATAGIYSAAEIARGLGPERRDRYFFPREGRFEIHDDLRAMVEFRRVNLIEPFSGLGAFDIIFCRNVLIYFDLDTRARICEQFRQMLTEKGVLLLGATENLYGVTDRFEADHSHETVLYHKVP